MPVPGSLLPGELPVSSRCVLTPLSCIHPLCNVKPLHSIRNEIRFSPSIAIAFVDMKCLGVGELPKCLSTYLSGVITREMLETYLRNFGLPSFNKICLKFYTFG